MSDFDVEKFRTEHECDEHWELRKKFLLAHHDKFPEDQLVCMAQVFTNIEFLGCSYPKETMERVAYLAKGVVEDYRENQKGRLKRTFVEASDAAGAKFKGTTPKTSDSTHKSNDQEVEQSRKQMRTSEPNSSRDHMRRSELNSSRDQMRRSELNSSRDQMRTSEPYSSRDQMRTSEPYSSRDQMRTSEPYSSRDQMRTSEPYSSRDQMRTSSAGETRTVYGPDITSMQIQNAVSPVPKHSKYGGVKTYHISRPVTRLSEGPFGKLVIIESDEVSNPISVITRSVQACQVPHEYVNSTTGNQMHLCKLFINDRLVAAKADFSAKSAKDLVSLEALQKLKETCYTIKIKQKFVYDTTVQKTEEVPNPTDTPLSDDNVGNRLLRMMGWKGGGLGRDNQGIEKPIEVKEHVRRSGLGLDKSAHSDSWAFHKRIKKLLDDYWMGDSKQDLVFSSDFSIDERKKIHQIGNKLHLKTRSYGKGDDRYLVVSKKVCFWDEVQELLQSGGSSDRYELIPPSRM